MMRDVMSNLDEIRRKRIFFCYLLFSKINTERRDKEEILTVIPTPLFSCLGSKSPLTILVIAEAYINRKLLYGTAFSSPLSSISASTREAVASTATGNIVLLLHAATFMNPH